MSFIYERPSEKFKTKVKNNHTAEYVNSRSGYYERVDKLASDKEGIFNVVGSEKFLHENVYALVNVGIPRSEIMLDKPGRQRFV